VIVPRFHHVNLGVPPDGIPAESGFLVDILGFRRIDPGEDLARRGATWFEGEDGIQVHLSADPDHRPAARAHVAVDFGSDLTDIGERLHGAAYDVDRSDTGDGDLVLLCQDPAGNRWELRGRDSAAG